MQFGYLDHSCKKFSYDSRRIEPRHVIEESEGIKVDASNTFDPNDPRFVRVSDEAFAGAKTYYEPVVENGETVGYFVRFVEVSEEILVMPEDKISMSKQPETVIKEGFQSMYSEHFEFFRSEMTNESIKAHKFDEKIIDELRKTLKSQK